MVLGGGEGGEGAARRLEVGGRLEEGVWRVAGEGEEGDGAEGGWEVGGDGWSGEGGEDAVGGFGEGGEWEGSGGHGWLVDWLLWGFGDCGREDVSSILVDIYIGRCSRRVDGAERSRCVRVRVARVASRCCLC